uniref:response regulator n=1 Tax=Escherichia coli TaxID=562 RepID=UPI00227DBF34
KPKIVCVVASFSNPCGATISRQRRLRLLELAVKHRFLIVEDDHTIAGNLYTFLEARGFLPDVAYSGPAALKRLEEQRFDAMILDIGLPGMDGNA